MAFWLICLSNIFFPVYTTSYPCGVTPSYFNKILFKSKIRPSGDHSVNSFLFFSDKDKNWPLDHREKELTMNSYNYYRRDKSCYISAPAVSCTGSLVVLLVYCSTSCFRAWITLLVKRSKWKLPVSHRLMASAISVLGEPERRSEPRCTSSQAGLLTVGHLSPSPIGNLQWTIEAARVKVHHRPYSFEDGPMVYPANTIDSRLRGD